MPRRPCHSLPPPPRHPSPQPPPSPPRRRLAPTPRHHRPLPPAAPGPPVLLRHRPGVDAPPHVAPHHRQPSGIPARESAIGRDRFFRLVPGVGLGMILGVVPLVPLQEEAGPAARCEICGSGEKKLYVFTCIQCNGCQHRANMMRLRGSFFEERAALGAKYQKLYEPLYTKRYNIVNRVVEVDGVAQEPTNENVAEGEIQMLKESQISGSLL
uniref:Predicted protein n=1 Tax=Hordeum vulgare subsp. vulgare TaxID=112509 RepID=F2D590_HORVV|nr:predicted protein [Hordeum vulgare subsp. vulgare]